MALDDPALVVPLTKFRKRLPQLLHRPESPHENDIVTARAGTVFSYDLLGRATQADFADGGQITIGYNDPARQVTITQKRTATDNLAVTETYNQLGLLTQRQLPGGRKVDITSHTFWFMRGMISVPERLKTTRKP